VRPRITVVGSINLDLVARCERMPRAGETVSGASFSRVPGGKGANQALACSRLGAEVTLIGAIGRDSFAEEALVELREASVDLRLTEVDAPTGVALVVVDRSGETAIVVAPGANDTLAGVDLPEHDAVLCQLEIPDAAVVSAWERCTGTFCLNAAPARPVTVDPDVTVVNRYELESLSARDGFVAVTQGAEDAVLLEDGEEIAKATPPRVEVVDGTGAGDAFHGLLSGVAAGGARACRGTRARVCRGSLGRLPFRCAILASHSRRGRRASYALALELVEQPLWRDDAEALLDPVAEKCAGYSSGSERHSDPSRLAEAVAGGFGPVDRQRVPAGLDELDGHPRLRRGRGSEKDEDLSPDLGDVFAPRMVLRGFGQRKRESADLDADVSHASDDSPPVPRAKRGADVGAPLGS